MKKTILFLISLLFSFSLCSCELVKDGMAKDIPEEIMAEKPGDEALASFNTEEIKPSDSVSKSCPNLYASLLFQAAGKDAEIKIFTSAEKGLDGSFLFDDNNTFFVSASIEDKNYILMEDESIQLGRPRVSVFEDSKGCLHIILSDIRTAQYNIYDFSYDPAAHSLSKTPITENAAINYWGEI